MPSPHTARQKAALGKLSPPRLGRVIGRERLFLAMDGLASAPGSWIWGPPGIGKTTLVATWLDARALPCVWLQIDTGDADPATFVHFLRAAARRLVPQRQLRMPLPNADDLRDVPGFVRRCFRRLCATLDLPWVLVLDNLQELGSSPLHAGIAAALAELPADARIVALSREPPGPAYARALAAQHLGVLEAADLRFTDAETGQLVMLHERSWAAPDLRTATDGWAAAMVLLLAARGELEPSAALHGGAARERLFAFFAGEVMEKMAPADATALTSIAFLPSATAPMAVAISGNPRAGELMANLADRSLFTERRTGSPATYTFHALFGEFLRARAATTLEAPALRALQRRAAQLLATYDQADTAISLLIAASYWDEGLELMLEQATPCVAQGRTATLHGWLTALPEPQRMNPQAQYWLGYCVMATEPARALQHFDQTHAGFAETGDLRSAFFVAAAAADTIVFLGASLDPLRSWLPTLNDYAPAYLMQRDVQTDLRVLPGLLATFVYLQTAHPVTAPLADLAERLLDQPLASSQRILLGSLAYYLLWTGQSERLDRMMIKIDRLCVGQDAAPATLLRWHGVGVLIRSLRGQVPQALQQARSAIDLAAGAVPGMQAKAQLMMVLAAVSARDTALARTHLAEAAAVMDPDSPIDATTYGFQHGLVMMLEGNCQGALQRMRSAVESGRASGWPLREHIALLGVTLTLARLDAFEESEAALQAVLAHPFHAAGRWHQWLSALIEAYLAERRSDRPRCLTALRRAFSLGREYGYDFGPMPYSCDDMMPRLASIALEHDIDTAFARGLIERHGLAAPAHAAAQWPWHVRIHTLGRFALERAGASATSARKESRKPLDLLKLVLALGGVSVPVPHLCAALWPDAPGDAARNSFDNALHRLRKLLGGDQHVLLEAGGVSLNANTCWTDVSALEACFTQASTAKVSDKATASSLVERALTLYQGEFLAGEEDLPDVLVARSRLQARFTRHMGEWGVALHQDGYLTEAARVFQRVVEWQPLAEDIYRRLITVLLAMGQRAEAYEAYRRCRQQLAVVLGIRPAPETDALVADLRNL